MAHNTCNPWSVRRWHIWGLEILTFPNEGDSSSPEKLVSWTRTLSRAFDKTDADKSQPEVLPLKPLCAGQMADYSPGIPRFTCRSKSSWCFCVQTTRWLDGKLLPFWIRRLLRFAVLLNFTLGFLRADVSKYRPEVYKSEKSKILKKIHKVALGKLLT